MLLQQHLIILRVYQVLFYVKMYSYASTSLKSIGYCVTITINPFIRILECEYI